MALLTCGGVDVLDGVVHLVARGAWWGRLRLDTATPPSGVVQLAAANGFTLTGFVRSSGVFAEVTTVQLVGGAGGLGTILKPRTWQNAQLRDPLGAIMRASGEQQSTIIDASILGQLLPTWTIIAETAARALDELCGAAGATWRVIDDGSVWLGVETWPTQKIQKGSDLLEAFPDEGRYVIGAASPWLLPGTALDGVGNVAAVDHYFDAYTVRSWAWV